MTAIDPVAASQRDDSAAAEASRVDLSEALLWLSAFHGHAVTPEVLRGGLPLGADAVIDTALVARAATNAGLEAVWFDRTLSQIPELVLPVVLLVDGRPCILLRKDEELDAAILLAPDRGAGTRQRIALPDLAARASRQVLFVRPMQSPTASPSPPDDQRSIWAMGWFWDVVGRFRGHYGTIIFAALIINILAVVFPLFTMTLYDRVVPNGATASLAALSIGVALSYVFDAVLRLARSKVIDQAGKQADLTLAGRIFEHVLGLPMAARPANVGVLASQLRDFDSVREFFTSSTLVAFADLFFAFLFIAVIVVIAGPLSLLVIGLVPVLIALGYVFQKPLERAARLLQQEASARHGILIETLVGFETIKVLGAQGRRQRLFEQSVAAAARTGEAVHHWSVLSSTVNNTVQQFGMLLVYVVGALMVIENRMSVGALVATGMLMMRIVTPITNMASMVTRSAQTMVAMRGIDRIMQLPQERPRGALFTGRRVDHGSVTFENVSFGYPQAKAAALRDVSFSVRPGERIAIVGRIGSGKTTLGRLLTGLYPPVEGRILIDGADIRQYDPINLRAGIGFVQQDVDLFQGTLRDNLVVGRPDVDDATLLKISAIAGVDAFAAEHSAGYDMVLAEGGRSLSGGQRQSVGLARVLLREPKIIFMDEPTAALDIASEQRFCEALNTALPRDTTLLIATHRPSLLRFVDRIIVFDRGTIVGDGPASSMLSQLAPTSA